MNAIDRALQKGWTRPSTAPQPRRAPSLLRRSERLQVSLRKGELSDLETIGRAWGVAASVVAWVAIQDFIARARRKLPEYGSPAGLGLVAAIVARVLPELTATAAAFPCPHCGKRRTVVEVPAPTVAPEAQG